MSDLKIAIIVPCYNEFLRLDVVNFQTFVVQNPIFHLCFVNDGSKDDTLSLLNKMTQANPEYLKVLDLPVNVGKAEAIRQGVLLLSGDYDYLGFLDADLSAPLEEIIPLAEILVQKKLDLVTGARVKLVGKKINRSAVRHYFGRVFATYQDNLLHLGNYDTQCGLKIFESKFAKLLFAEKFISSWLFDIEIFVRARIALGKEEYQKRIAEIPLNEWKEVKGSKMKITDFLRAPYEVLKIYRKYK